MPFGILARVPNETYKAYWVVVGTPPVEATVLALGGFSRLIVSIENIKRAVSISTLFARWQQRCGLSLSVPRQLVLFLLLISTSSTHGVRLDILFYLHTQTARKRHASVTHNRDAVISCVCLIPADRPIGRCIN